MRGTRSGLVGAAALAFVALPADIVSRSLAQEIAPTGQYQEGVAVGGWLLYPRLFVGAVWDSNPTQFPTENSNSNVSVATENSNSNFIVPTENGNSDVSVRVVPDFRAVYDGGIHRSLLYGIADARFFNSDTVSATAGFTHVYEAMRDLVFTFQGNYTRQTDLFTSALNFNNGAIGPNISPDANVPIIINPFGTTPSVNPTAYNQFTLGASALKNFDNAFVIVSGTAFYIAFDKFPELRLF